MDVSVAALPTSWMGEIGWESMLEPVKKMWNGITTTAAKLWQSWSNWISEQLKKVNIFGVNLGGWFEDDPIGATAGTGAALLSGGVILLSGGAIMGKLMGGIKVMWQAAKNLPRLVGLGGLIRWGVQGVQKLWNFNWNISDNGIRDLQKSQLTNLAGSWGEALGSLVGTLCGFTLGRIAHKNQANLIRFNPDLLAKLDALRLDNFDDDGGIWEESLQNLKTAVNSSIRVLSNIAMLEAYLNVRKAIKAVARGVDLNWMWPGLNEKIQQWGADGGKPWSFAQKQEEFIESLPEGAIKNFVEEFLESAQDQCAESTIQVSYAL